MGTRTKPKAYYEDPTAPILGGEGPSGAGDAVVIDVDVLTESRLLVQANSGAGKSYLLRRLLEQTHGRLQHLVIDVEGEFHTLREKYDYVVAGKGGDCPADIKSAALLAERLLELNVSAIIDIYELGAQRSLFVRRFLDSLMNVRRELWHPALVVVDEAHMFCPEAGKSESAGAVIDLMTRGRKRGFCGVLATQRIAKLHKDAAAEANNKLIGRSALDIDMKRAAAELGMTAREEMQKLRVLPAGVFYAFGPAISTNVTMLKVGPVETTHPKSGQRAMAPTPPKERVRKVLAQLADLPHEAEEEAKSSAELRAKVRQLELELRKAAAGGAVKVETKVEYRDRPILTPADVEVMRQVIGRFDAFVHTLADIGSEISERARTIEDALGVAESFLVDPRKWPSTRSVAAPVSTPAIAVPGKSTPASGKKWPGTGALVPSHPPARQKILDTIALLEQLDIEVSRDTLAAWYGVHPNNKAFVNNVGALRSAGLVNGLALTEAGYAAARTIEPPTQDEARELIMRPLSPARRKLLRLLIEYAESGHDGMARDELAAAYGVHPNNKAFVNNLGALRTRQLVTRGWPVRAGAVLFLEGGA